MQKSKALPAANTPYNQELVKYKQSRQLNSPNIVDQSWANLGEQTTTSTKKYTIIATYQETMNKAENIATSNTAAPHQPNISFEEDETSSWRVHKQSRQYPSQESHVINNAKVCISHQRVLNQATVTNQKITKEGCSSYILDGETWTLLKYR